MQPSAHKFCSRIDWLHIVPQNPVNLKLCYVKQKPLLLLSLNVGNSASSLIASPTSTNASITLSHNFSLNDYKQLEDFCCGEQGKKWRGSY